MKLKPTISLVAAADLLSFVSACQSGGHEEVGAPVEPREDSLRIFLENAAHLAGDGRHVDADQLVDVNVTRRRVEKMKALGMTCEYIEVPGGSHSSAGRENIGKVLAFLAEQQKP